MKKKGQSDDELLETFFKHSFEKDADGSEHNCIGNESDPDLLLLKERLQEFGEDIDSRITTPSMEYFEQLVAGTKAFRGATLSETSAFVMMGGFVLSAMGVGLRHGFDIPIFAILAAVWVLVPFMLVFYMPKQKEVGGD